MTQPAPQKFGFDTWFGDDGRVVEQAPHARMRRAYTPAEVEVIRQQAFQEGQADQRQRDESQTSAALAQIAAACADALGGLDGVIARFQAEAAELALSTGEVIAGGALDGCPTGPLTAALEALAQELAGTSRLVVRANAASPEVREAIEKAAGDAGFVGRVVLRDDGDLGPAAFVVEWPDGRAEFDPTEAAARVRALVGTALSADADGRSDTMNGEA